MTNFEKIKGLSLRQFAYFAQNITILELDDFIEWLQQEAEVDE